MCKGDLAAAELLYREALEGWRKTLGSQHPNTLKSISRLDALLLAKAQPRHCWSAVYQKMLCVWTKDCTTLLHDDDKTCSETESVYDEKRKYAK